ncbi:MAG: transglutaminase-like domain-containing protein, partial [Terriglobales bacterium]
VYNIPYMRTTHLLNPGDENLIRSDLKTYLQLPPTISQEISKIVDAQTNPNENWFVQAERLCVYMRKNYETSGEAPAPEGDPISDFLLRRKVGSEAEFAGGYAVLCRWAGLPARVIQGYGPGRLNEVSGNREVHESDFHPWVEVFIPDYGWVPFDPTPEGFMPAATPDKDSNPLQTQLDKLLAKKHLTPKQILLCLFTVLATVFGILALIPLIKAMIAHIKAWLAERKKRGPAYKFYTEVVRDLRGLKTGIKPAHTPSEIAEIFKKRAGDMARDGGEVSPELSDLVARFMKLYTYVYFGQGEGLDQLRQMQGVIHSLAKSSRVPPDVPAGKEPAAATRGGDMSDRMRPPAGRR